MSAKAVPNARAMTGRVHMQAQNKREPFRQLQKDESIPKEPRAAPPAPPETNLQGYNYYRLFLIKYLLLLLPITITRLSRALTVLAGNPTPKLHFHLQCLVHTQLPRQRQEAQGITEQIMVFS